MVLFKSNHLRCCHCTQHFNNCLPSCHYTTTCRELCAIMIATHLVCSRLVLMGVSWRPFSETCTTRALWSLVRSIALRTLRRRLRPLSRSSRPPASCKSSARMVHNPADTSAETFDEIVLSRIDDSDPVGTVAIMAIMEWTVRHYLAMVDPPQSLRSLTVMIGCLGACFPHHSWLVTHYSTR